MQRFTVFLQHIHKLEHMQIFKIEVNFQLVTQMEVMYRDCAVEIFH